METARNRLVKTIDHKITETRPVHIMGFDNIDHWIEKYKVETYNELRLKIGLDFLEARPVYTGENALLENDLWGVPLGKGGSSGSGYSDDAGGIPLANAESVKQIESYPWPDPDQFDYSIARSVLEKIPHDIGRMVKIQYVNDSPDRDRFSLASHTATDWLPVICTVFNLFGIENALIKMVMEPVLIEAALGKIREFMVEFMQRLLSVTYDVVDIVWLGDDFGTQKGMMFSPKLWRKYLKPVYKDLFAEAKTYDLPVWFHSCGSFLPVLPDLIDIGMDVWETVQVHAEGNDPEYIKKEFGKSITFYGGINSQRTLPFGSTEDVRKEVIERLRVLGNGGGYICGSDHSILPDVPDENVLALIETVKAYKI